MTIYLYEIECITEDHIYVGIAKNPEQRLIDHNSGSDKASKFTKKFGVKNFKVVSEYDSLKLAKMAENNHVKWLMQEFPSKIICGGAFNSSKLEDLKKYRETFNLRSKSQYFISEYKK